MKGKPLTEEAKHRILALDAQGLTSRQIGDELGLSFGTCAKIVAARNHELASAKGRSKAAEVPAIDARIEKLLSGAKRQWSIVELTDAAEAGFTAVRESVARLKASGKNLIITDDGVERTHLIPKGDDVRIDVSKFKGKEYRFGVTGDNHLCSKYARMDVLNALYDKWAEDGVTDVYQCGNMIDGEARFNKFDLLTRPGIHAQLEYFVNEWPHREGIKTHFVTGDDHEGWYVQREGLNIALVMGAYARDAKRADMNFLGHMEHDIVFQGTDNGTRMRVIHAGGGTAYAISYKTQKIVESYQGGEKPNILLVGHYHKFDFGYPREVSAIQVGCTEDQTPFMRKLNIQAMVGGVTLKFTVDPYGFAHGIDVKWDPFYDRGFYKKWNYRH